MEKHVRKAGSHRRVAVWLVLLACPVCSFAETTTYGADGRIWRETPLTNVLISAGSALDLSGLWSGEEAGKRGRATVASDGSLAFANDPTGGVRLIGCVHTYWDAWHLCRGKSRDEQHAFVDRFAEQVRRQGFNLLRLHGTMDELVNELKEACPISDERNDFYDYLFYALARQGVYIHVDLAAYGVRVPRWANLEAKHGVFFKDPFWWDAYRRCVREILDHVNPYTGRAWKDEPALLGVMAYNEQGTGAKIAEQRNGWVKSGSQKDFARFSLANAVDTERVARETGYEGLWSCYNSNPDIGASAARWRTSDAVCYNVHYGHPEGNRVRQESSLSESAMYGSDFCFGNTLRFVDRPFFVTEYSHAFWNRRRFEAALLFPSYASLNGYSAVMWHTAGTLLSVKGYKIDSFRIANSPAMRAAAFLSVCLYRRRDVKEATHTVVTSYSNDWLVAHSDGWGSMDQAKISLLLKYGIACPKLKRPDRVKTAVRPDITLPPDTGDEVVDGVWFSRAKAGTAPKTFSMENFVRRLRQDGVLGPDNRTDPRNGVYQSETGELLIDGLNKTLSVITPRTEAVCAAPANKNVRYGRLRILEQSEEGCVAVTSVDGKPLATSGRMVFLWITREANTGMKTSDDDKILEDAGTTPLLLKTGRVRVVLDCEAAKRWSLHMLDYSGERLEQLSVERRSDGIAFVVDTSATKAAPTPFFELVSE